MKRAAWLQEACCSEITNWDRDLCIARWRELFGQIPPKHTSAGFLRSALAHEVQVAQHGGLQRPVKRALKAALKSPHRTYDVGAQTNVGSQTKRARKPACIVLRPGTLLIREWNGRRYQVHVEENGYRLDGKTYRSLSAIAKRITGAHWSGPRFFGVKP
ncbi:MAG: DUF2924 domain-containing protein [Pseudomonadota bacterium]